LHDPGVVQAECEDERRLAVRKAAHALAERPDVRDVVFSKKA
jgi:hypothetical protein